MVYRDLRLIVRTSDSRSFARRERQSKGGACSPPLQTGRTTIHNCWHGRGDATLETKSVANSTVSARIFTETINPGRGMRTGVISWVLAAWVTILLPFMPAGAALNCDVEGVSRSARQVAATTRPSASTLPGGATPALSSGTSDTSKAAAPPGEEMATPPPVISSQAQTVSEIAMRHGDRTYLMLDKVRGEIILFVNGEPIYIPRALTGQNLATCCRRGLIIALHDPSEARRKVTPAGRFTVLRSPIPPMALSSPSTKSMARTGI